MRLTISAATIFFISSMAMHTQNLRQDPHASLLIAQPDVSGDPLGAARLTLLGDVTEAPSAEVRELYLARYENAKFWQTTPTLLIIGCRSGRFTSSEASA
jgi:heme iron utilization protein